MNTINYLYANYRLYFGIAIILNVMALITLHQFKRRSNVLVTISNYIMPITYAVCFAMSAIAVYYQYTILHKVEWVQALFVILFPILTAMYGYRLLKLSFPSKTMQAMGKSGRLISSSKALANSGTPKKND